MSEPISIHGISTTLENGEMVHRWLFRPAPRENEQTISPDPIDPEDLRNYIVELDTTLGIAKAIERKLINSNNDQ
jgi:hypothetical protein